MPGSGETLAAVRVFCADALAGAPAPGSDTVYDGEHVLWKEFRAAGLPNWWLPAEFGGRGAGMAESVEVVAELAYHDAGFAFAAFLPVLASRMLELYGEPDLAAAQLSELAATGGFCAALGSEAAAGSELTRTATTASRRGDTVVLNGDKAFSTNADAALFGLVLARDADSERALSVVLVPRDTPGYAVGEHWRMAGLRGTGTYPATLREVEVPVGHVLRGSGLRVLEVGLNASRLLMAALAVGVVRRIRDMALDYAASRELGGRPLNRNAVVAARMGQLEMELETMKAVCATAAAEYDALNARPDRADAFAALGVVKSAVVAKMHCGQTGWGIAARASEWFGGLGYTEDHPVQRALRDMRHVSIVEGGDDVLRELMYARFVRRAARRG